jgi:hypothetical protein
MSLLAAILKPSRRQGDLDGGNFLALLREHFDPCVGPVEVPRVVGDFLDVEVGGISAWRFGVSGHREFFIGGRLELCRQESWRCDGEEQKAVAHEGVNPHEFLLCWKARGSVTPKGGGGNVFLNTPVWLQAGGALRV